jgi:uncharacterized alpha/beta hydrolase family protein
MKRIFFTLIIALVATTLFAKSEKTKAVNETVVEATVPTLQLIGFVTDKNSNEALVGVEVKIEGIQEKTYTDFDGKFTFTNLKPGEYNIVASYISYQKNSIEHVDLKNATRQVSIKLESSN